jgi:hypothetical protein
MYPNSVRKVLRSYIYVPRRSPANNLYVRQEFTVFMAHFYVACIINTFDVRATEMQASSLMAIIDVMLQAPCEVPDGSGVDMGVFLSVL